MEADRKLKRTVQLDSKQAEPSKQDTQVEYFSLSCPECKVPMKKLNDLGYYEGGKLRYSIVSLVCPECKKRFNVRLNMVEAK